MNAVFKICLLSILLLISLPPLVQADNLPAPLVSDPKYSFLTQKQEDNFMLMYNTETVKDIPGLVTTARTAYEDVDDFFPDYVFRATVVVAGSNSEFRLLVNVGDAPDTAKALNWNTGYNGLVVIKSPAMLEDFRKVLELQMAHIAVRTRLTYYKSMPEWYQDGLATYAADGITQDQRYAATTMAATGTWMSLDELERTYKNMTIYNFDEQKYFNARAQAATLVDNIGSLYGSRALIAIMDNYTESGNVNQAFVNQTTFTPDTLNTVYKNSISGVNNTSNSKPDNGTIEGYLRYADGEPASGTTLVLSGTGASFNVTSGADGHYSIAVAPGNYEAIVPGWTTGSQVKVQAGKRVAQNLTLVPPPVKDEPASWSFPSTGDMALYGVIAAVNVVGIIAVLFILRRNWH